MDPVVATILVIATFAAGIFVGWKWREIAIKQEIKDGNFDPARWGRKDEG